MKNEEILKKYEVILGDNKELHVIKGKLSNLQLVSTKDGSEKYYAFDVVCVKKYSEDEYGQSFNKYHLIMPVELSKQFKQDDMTAMKNSEVLVVINQSGKIRSLKREGQEDIKVNNISLYVVHIQKIKDISKPTTRVINI